MSDSVPTPHLRHPRTRECAMCGTAFNQRHKPSTLCHSVYRVRVSEGGKQLFVSGNFCSICLAALYEHQAPRMEKNHPVEYITPAIRPNGTEIPSFPKFRARVDQSFKTLFFDAIGEAGTT